jgi:hypothetical protein
MRLFSITSYLIFFFFFNYLYSEEISNELIKDEREWKNFFYHEGYYGKAGKKILIENYLKDNLPIGFPLEYVQIGISSNKDRKKIRNSGKDLLEYCSKHAPELATWMEIFLELPYEVNQIRNLDYCVESVGKNNLNELMVRRIEALKNELSNFVWDPTFQIDPSLLPDGIEAQMIESTVAYVYNEAIYVSMLPDNNDSQVRFDLKRLHKKNLEFYFSPIKSVWLERMEQIVPSYSSKILNKIEKHFSHIEPVEWELLPQERNDRVIEDWRELIQKIKLSKFFPDEGKKIYAKLNTCLSSWRPEHKRYLRWDVVSGQLSEEKAFISIENKIANLNNTVEIKFWSDILTRIQKSKWQNEKREVVLKICQVSSTSKDPSWQSLLFPIYKKLKQKKLEDESN